MCFPGSHFFGRVILRASDKWASAFLQLSRSLHVRWKVGGYYLNNVTEESIERSNLSSNIRWLCHYSSPSANSEEQGIWKKTIIISFKERLSNCFSIDKTNRIRIKDEAHGRVNVLCVVFQDNVDLGDLMFSLCYLPTAGRLTITMIKARNLKAMDITGASGNSNMIISTDSHWFSLLSCKKTNVFPFCFSHFLDPYVKVSLMCEGRRLKKRKTSTKRNTLNPVYNEAIVFDVPPENIEQISLSIAVMDYDR